MNSTNEHPEMSIDRALEATLESAALAELQVHLKSCDSCRAHLQTAPFFQAESAARARDAKLNQVAIDAAMARVLSVSLQSRPHRWRRMGVIAPAFAFAVTAGMAAALWVPGSWNGHPIVAPLPQQPPTSAAELARGKPQLKPSGSGTETEAAHSDTPRADTSIAVVSPSSLPPQAPVTVQPPTRSQGSALPTAAQLFAQAQAARRSGQSAAATTLYQTLQREFPTTREALLSHAWLGRLHLDQGRAGPALRQFERYLRHGGPATEEAMAGRALALKSLLRTNSEAEAWQALLSRFPSSIYAERARARLKQIAASRTR